LTLTRLKSLVITHIFNIIALTQLQTAQALLSLLGLLGIIATNLLAIKFLAKDHRNEKAIEHIPITDLQLLFSIIYKRPNLSTILA
jgi:hypothetical protein